jgi:hypothetical protein
VGERIGHLPADPRDRQAGPQCLNVVVETDQDPSTDRIELAQRGDIEQDVRELCASDLVDLRLEGGEGGAIQLSVSTHSGPALENSTVNIGGSPAEPQSRRDPLRWSLRSFLV